MCLNLNANFHVPVEETHLPAFLGENETASPPHRPVYLKITFRIRQPQLNPSTAAANLLAFMEGDEML